MKFSSILEQLDTIAKEANKPLNEGAGPSPAAVKYHMKKAKDKAEKYAAQYGVQCTPRLQRASNGEAAIVYDIVTKSGKKETVLSVNAVKESTVSPWAQIAEEVLNEASEKKEKYSVSFMAAKKDEEKKNWQIEYVMASDKEEAVELAKSKAEKKYTNSKLKPSNFRANIYKALNTFKDKKTLKESAGDTYYVTQMKKKFAEMESMNEDDNNVTPTQPSATAPSTTNLPPIPGAPATPGSTATPSTNAAATPQQNNGSEELEEDETKNNSHLDDDIKKIHLALIHYAQNTDADLTSEFEWVLDQLGYVGIFHGSQNPALKDQSR